MASTRLAEVPNPGGKGARNSLLLYFAIINLSLSSCEEVGSGFGPLKLCSLQFDKKYVYDLHLTLVHRQGIKVK